MKFNEMNLKSGTVKALHDMDITSPTKIQEESIPIALDGKNLIAQARTGSGKTFAFSIPILERLSFDKTPECIILVPTRELCRQVAEVFRDLGKYTPGVKLVQVYGGVSIHNQIAKIMNGANVIVATPGRLIDLFERRAISFDNIKFVVLDEADRMLDMGFMPDVQYIMSKIKTNPQLFLFSATIIEEIKELSNQFTDGAYVDINVSKDSMTVGNTKQYYYLIRNFRDKYYDFVRILRKEKPEHTLVFTNTKKTADWLESRLSQERNLGVKIGLLSGNMTQAKREKVTELFKEQKINFLIATDVAARGLDIPDVSHVINYDVPQFEENYVHRIGRTSRMGKPGTALTLCIQDEYIYLVRIEGFINKNITKLELPTREKRPRYPNRHHSSNMRGKRQRNFKERSFKRSESKEDTPRKRLPFF